MRTMNLASFLQQVEVRDAPLDEVFRAYKMDSTMPHLNMRAAAGLGTCNCCDYFTFDDSTVVLIEETDLRHQIKNLQEDFAQDLQKEFRALDDGEQEKVERRLREYLREENRLKVYGSLLVLCRLERVLEDRAEANALSRRASFWLIYSEEDAPDDTFLFDNVRDQLKGDLRSVLTGAVIDDVQILPAENLAKKLPSTPTVA